MQHNASVATDQHNHNHGLPIGNEGLFLSHSVLGTFVFCLGLWWWIQSVRRRFSASRRPLGKYFADVSYNSACCPNQIGEGLAKMSMCIIGMGVEAATVSIGRHHEYAHYPFYAAMLIASLVDILQSTVLFLPDGSDYMCHVLPFVFQAYCLRAQAYDQPHVTATCRLVSSYLGVLVASSMMAEMCIRSHFLFTWIKCFMVMLSGWWTWQIGIMLNPPGGQPWEENSHDNVMYVAIINAWQMFGVAVVQLITLLIIAKFQGVPADWNIQLQNNMSDRDNIQYTKLLNDENSDE
ncbi:Transmembrane protein 45B [Paragonimus heterotremus]|uniref:Transmembrane protein 45B n=1 Tax=Paragonimus heterotremus TaxID=100268 RepID=A0A8J4SP32_9TREM|nr:Transmembrane protein 45B [Paragonimus heterotremus]